MHANYVWIAAINCCWSLGFVLKHQVQPPNKCHLNGKSSLDPCGVTFEISVISGYLIDLKILFNIAMENGPFIDDFPVKTNGKYVKSNRYLFFLTTRLSWSICNRLSRQGATAVHGHGDGVPQGVARE